VSRSLVPLGDALAAVFDNRGKTPRKLGGDWSASGHRVVSALNIKGHRVDENNHHYISDDLYQKWMKEPLRAGDVLLTSEAPTGEVAFLDRDVDWALGQRLFALRALPGLLDGRFLYYSLRGGNVRHQLMARSTGTTVSGVRQSELLKVMLDLPSVEEQVAIAATLGALDDKIESTRRVRDLLRSLGSARLVAAIAASPSNSLPLRELTTSITRGVAPKYADDDPGAPLVLNQKCVRDGWVTTSQARRMFDRDVAPQKMVTDGDILVNSTGTGTLGRVGRWHAGSIYADGHVSIVKVDTKVADPTVVAYALFRREADIEALATGSTGQTELSPGRLSALTIELPDREVSAELESTLLALEARIHGLRVEEGLLSSLRDALLPELLSGRIGVSEVATVLA